MRPVLSAIVVLALAAPAASEAPWPSPVLARVAGGFELPTHVTHAGDGSGRVFVVEQAGRIRILRGSAVSAGPFLDIRSRVRCCGEEGLLSVAFPPGYAAQGRFYVYYTDQNGDNVVARYALTSNPDVADPASEEVVLTIPHPNFGNHNGGQIAFGADGYLYVGTGDGGGGGDPDGNAQDPLSLLGKLLRIDVETGDPATYTIPPGNPFVGVPGYREETWALGLRNPWRFSFDRTTGDLYVGDVGQGDREEIDVQPGGSPGGQNYGWDVLEGTQCFEPPSGCTPPPGYVAPVAEYDHSEGCSVTGGFVVGSPGIAGRRRPVYVYGDFCSGRLWGLRRAAGGAWESRLLAQTSLTISTFGQGPATRTAYVADYATGEIHRLSLVSPTSRR